MNGVNGSGQAHDPNTSVVAVSPMPKVPRVTLKRLKILEALAVPFEPVVIQWQIVETVKVAGIWRGRVLPYADKLAYLDRLNGLLTPMGWSTHITVLPPISSHENGRSGPGKLVVTCQLTIHGIGCHASTGEKWAFEENAATSAEAQALKRSCAHFGLGAYLYYFFRGLWLTLDDKQQIIREPELPVWATPDGWRGGARPSIERIRDDQGPALVHISLIREIEGMRDELGTQVYRGILKQHRVWEPSQICTPEMAANIIADMKEARGLMLRASSALEHIGKPAFDEIIAHHRLRSVSDFGNLDTLRRVVADLEPKLHSTEPH